jgi:CDP-paratose 2-epimerase
MKILVTGGSGYLGTHVRNFFGADDYSRRSGLNILNVHDLNYISTYDVVIHLAALMDKNPSAAEECFETNAEGTLNVIRHVKPGAIFIYISTKDVYGAFADAYKEVPEDCRTDYCGQTAFEWSKFIGERYVDYYARARNIRSCIFRLSTTYARPTEDNEYGFVVHYIESIKNGWPLKLPQQGRPIRDILHVDDLSRASQAFINSSIPRGLYNVGGGINNSISLRELVDKIGALTGCRPIIDEEANVPAPVPTNYISDISFIKNELHWQPEIDIDTGLQSLL